MRCHEQLDTSIHAVYCALEHELDHCTSPAMIPLWQTVGPHLRRAEALAAELKGMGISSTAAPSEATADYIDAIRIAAADDNATGGGRLLAHVHARFMADLLDAQVRRRGPAEGMGGHGDENPTPTPLPSRRSSAADLASGRSLTSGAAAAARRGLRH